MPHASHARQSALVVGILLLIVYVVTGAPALTFWDAGEFATAIGTFGIPHPPGTPLYVAIGSALWHLAPTLTPVQAGTLLSALSTATACGIAAWMVTRVTGRRLPGIVAGLAAGAMGTIWTNATETEVYAVSLLAVALQLATAWRGHSRDDDRARVLLAYIAALSIPLHLSALVATPAAMLLAHTSTDGRIRWPHVGAGAALVLASILLGTGRPALAASVMLALLVAVAAMRASGARAQAVHRRAGLTLPWLRDASIVTLFAWSAVFIMLVRAQHLPVLNQGDPHTLASLYDVIIRAQYDVAGPWPRRAPFWLQLANFLQYSDWQVALGAWNDVTPSLLRTPFTVVGAVLGAIGAIAHWRTHRVSARAALALMLLSTVGVCVTLNLRAGPSFGFGILPDAAIREARERDYFFALAFWLWGLWIGCGAYALARRMRQPMLALLVPVALVAGSWTALARDAMPDRRIATMLADELLRETPTRGMLFTAGDNDSYALWYRQAVDSVRTDVQVVVTSLLPANWYLRERARAAGFAAETLATPAALGRAAILASRQLDAPRVVAVSIVLSSAERREFGRLARVTCWRRVGLIDIGSRAVVCPPRVDIERTFESAGRLRPLLVDSVRQSPDGMVSAFQRIARCPSATVAAALRGGKAVDALDAKLLDITCNLW